MCVAAGAAVVSRRRIAPLPGLALLLLLWCAVGVMAPAVGVESIDAVAGLADLFRGVDSDAARILALRLPRVLLGLFAGGALAMAGASLQTLLRNDLATPYTLGISFAGAFGAFLALSLPIATWTLGPLGSVGLFAFLFAATAALGLDRLASRRAGLGPGELLLAGVTLNFVCGAAILLLRYLADPLRLRAMDRWMMGGLPVGSWADLAPVPVLLLPALVWSLAQMRALDQLAFGEEMASARGVDVARSQRAILLSASLLTAAVVAVTGPIGFVGLLVPHAVRSLLGPRHAVVLPASFLLGGAFLVAADAGARSISLVGRGSELPVGILTALLGGPLFLLLLLRRKGARREA